MTVWSLFRVLTRSPIWLSIWSRSADSRSSSSGVARPSTTHGSKSALYYSVLDSDAPDLGTVMSATGQKAFDMTFILADGSSCGPAWNGTDPMSSDTQVAEVTARGRRGATGWRLSAKHWKMSGNVAAGRYLWLGCGGRRRPSCANEG
jgi:hypothetical protein